MGASFSLPKQWINGETLTHTDLNTQFNTILDNVAVASGIASLDSSTLVVQNPVNATATPTASKIPIANGSGKLVAGWGGSASTLATLDSSTHVVEPALTLYDGSGNRSASATSGANIIPVADGSGDIHLNFIPDTLTGKTVATCTSIGMTGEGSATSATSPVTLDMGTATAGDRIFVQVEASLGADANAEYYFTISKSSGTATIVIGNTHTSTKSPIAKEGNISDATTSGRGYSCIVQVTGSGTLVLDGAITQFAATLSINNIQIYAFYLKKQ